MNSFCGYIRASRNKASQSILTRRKQRKLLPNAGHAHTRTPSVRSTLTLQRMFANRCIELVYSHTTNAH